MSAPDDDRTDLSPETRLALATWPQIDPTIESIVNRIAAAYKLLDNQMRDSLGHVGLTKEEFKVLIALHAGPRTHGALCRELHVSTGAMTNRLDKLERATLVSRSRDPTDRRGVLLEWTDAGRARCRLHRRSCAPLRKSDHAPGGRGRGQLHGKLRSGARGESRSAP